MESLDIAGDMGRAILGGCLLEGALRFSSSAGCPSYGIENEDSAVGRGISEAEF
jgi:hypothetical protein